jgi:photosystem II stability/assembly factor-like uncharacterized protein
MNAFVSYLLAAVLAQWIPQNSGTVSGLRGVSAVNNKEAWASGQKGVFIRTTNGGVTWRSGVVPGAEPLDFRGVQAFGAGTAVLMSSGSGRESRVYRTTDDGAHWKLTLQNDDEKGFYDALAFWDDKRGLLLGDPVSGRFTIMRTEDGGVTWKAIESTGMPAATDGEGAFAASGTCLAVGRGGRAWFGTGGPSGGRVFRSDNWGKTWSVSVTPIRHDSAAAGIFSIAFSGALHGVAVGGDYQKAGDDRDNVILSEDGGGTWKPALGKHPGGYREAVAWIPGRPETLIATGPNGTDLSVDGGRSWKPFSATGFHALSFSANGDGWAVGARGAIAKLLIPAPDRGAYSRSGTGARAGD